MTCSICGKSENGKARCTAGHYVCDACHTSGMHEILSLCFHEHSKDPIVILEKMMTSAHCHMHGPEHHVMVGAALLTAYHNAGGQVDLHTALPEMHRRGSQVPGGACGFWGACGAGISTGIYLSIVTQATPLTQEAWSLSNQMTARALDAISRHGGPRCCKRDSYLAVAEAAAFTEEKLGIAMELTPAVCSRWMQNRQCRQRDCPFYPVGG